MVRFVREVSAFVLLVSTLFSVQAQNTRRGFKLLEKADYEKAMELFSGSLSENKDNLPSRLGLMLVLADDSTKYFDLVESWKHGSYLASQIDKFIPEDLEYIGEYFYNTEERHINRPVKKKIEYAVQTVEAKLIKYVREENNLDLVYRVLEEFPDFRHFNNVIHIRNQLEFRKYEKQNTLPGYLEFIEKFPEAAQVEKAKRYRNKLAFESACKVNTPEAYKRYIKEYPDAAEINQATKKLHAAGFEVAKKTGTIQALEAFMSEFPEALELREAGQLLRLRLYEYAKKIQTLEAYNEFIRKYPEGQQYVDIFNLKSLDNGMKFHSGHPVSPDNMIWVRSFEEEGTEELNACIAADTANNYVVGSTVFRSDTGYTDSWIIKLDIDGKMIWNKYVGEAFNDQLDHIVIGPNNEVIGAGYTWTGTDSLSRESWVFKLASDGKKLWSRKLGKMNINTVSSSKNGLLYIGGHLVNDSLQDLYSIAVLNESGKKLWARTYTGKGHITKIDETADGYLFIAGTGWCAKIDPKGYIQHEFTFNASDSIVTSAMMEDNSVSLIAVRDSLKMVIHGIDPGNKPLPEKIINLPEIKWHVNSLIPAGSELIILITFDDHQSVNWIDLRSGNIISSYRLPSEIKYSAVAIDRSNNLLIGACSKEIIVLKNNGIRFR